jgi:glycosyltransferase involved in cell wall biosynthesis
MKPSSARKIVFINQATGYLTIDIINAFVNSGSFSDVALITGSVRVQDIQLNDRVYLSKIALYDRGNPKKKFFSWLKGTFQVFYLLLTRYRHYEVFYITIPPFAYLLSLIVRNRFSILVFDVYPDVLQIYNIKPSHALYRMWSRWNKRLFKQAYRIYTIGEGMARLLDQYTDRSKISIIPNWTGLTQVKEIKKNENFFIRQHQLDGKFIVQYSGNIGYTHNVEVLVDIAYEMRDDTDVFFLIIGRGEKFNAIKDRVEQYQLKNCSLLTFQPDNVLNYTLSAADLGVVLLDDKTAHVSLPSKIYNLQAVGVPILGIADTNSELAIHLENHNNGSCFNPRDTQGIIRFITEMKADKNAHEQLKEKSRVAGKRYTMLNALEYVKIYV